MLVPEHFKRVVVEDFEFIPDVPHYRPVCGVFHELRNGETMRLWGDQLGDKPPYSMGPDSLIVGYNLEAELKVHRALGWPMPACCADLYFEFRHRTSGLSGWPPKRSRKLLDAAAFYGLPCIDAVEKQEMRDRILKGPPYSKEERQAIISYCDSDVRLECRLLQVMAPDFRWPYVVYRGRYAAALALTDLIGTPA